MGRRGAEEAHTIKKLFEIIIPLTIFRLEKHIPLTILPYGSRG